MSLPVCSHCQDQVQTSQVLLSQMSLVPGLPHATLQPQHLLLGFCFPSRRPWTTLAQHSASYWNTLLPLLGQQTSVYLLFSSYVSFRNILLSLQQECTHPFSMLPRHPVHVCAYYLPHWVETHSSEGCKGGSRILHLPAMHKLLDLITSPLLKKSRNQGPICPSLAKSVKSLSARSPAHF